MYLIIGIDPGTTTGIAAVNFQGKVHRVHSSRNMGVDEIVKFIISLGRPSVIASDVSPTPDTVLKVASSLGCSVFTLYEPLSVSDKNALTSAYGIEDVHSRDALAAALNAYNKYKNKLSKISALGYDDEVKHRVLQGTSVEKAVREVHPKSAEVKKPVNVLPARPATPAMQALDVQNKVLREELKLQEFEINQLKKEILSLKKKPKHDSYGAPVLKQQEKVIESLEYRINLLEAKLRDSEKIKGLWHKIASGKIIPVGVYPEVYSGITLAEYRLNSDDVKKLENAKMVFTADAKNREMLSKHQISVSDLKHVQKAQGLVYLSNEDYQKLLHPKLKSIESIVSEYRTERGKS